MFLGVVFLIFAVTSCTARVIDVSGKQSAWERSGKFEGDIMLTDEQRNGLIKPATRMPDEIVPFVTDDVFNVSDKQSAWERSGKFEGDIMLTEEQMRNGLNITARRWPNREVPFFIDNMFSTVEQNIIMNGINQFTIRTSIRMVRRNFRPVVGDWVHVTGAATGCWSFVGRIRGRQQLNLQRNGCLTVGIVIHEFLHALGFFHEHSRTDRDDYVTILWQNIEPGTENNFHKQNADRIASFGVPYDYRSIMHYGAHAFTVNGQATILPKDPNAEIGQRDGFSEKDIEKLEIMYGISSSTTEEISSSTTEEISSSTTEENSSNVTRSQFITLIIITLHVLTHLQ